MYSISTDFLSFLTISSCIQHVSTLVWTTQLWVTITLVKHIRNKSSFKKMLRNLGGGGGGGKLSGQLPDEAKPSQLYLCSKGHRSGQLRKALPTGASEGGSLSCLHPSLSAIKSNLPQLRLTEDAFPLPPGILLSVRTRAVFPVAWRAPASVAASQDTGEQRVSLQKITSTLQLLAVSKVLMFSVFCSALDRRATANFQLSSNT